MLGAKRPQIERFEFGIRHKSWCEEVLKNLGRPFAVENWTPHNSYFGDRTLTGPWRIPPLVIVKGLSGAFSLKEFIERPNAAPNFTQKVLFI